MQGRFVWEPLYLAAAPETDNTKLPHRIAAARAAISARFDSLPEENTEEREAIENALSALKERSQAKTD